MAGTLGVRAIFGVKGNVANNVLYLEDGVIVYPAGNYLVKLNTATKAQEFVACSDRGCGVTAMALSPSRKFLAVAEVSSDPAEGCIVSVYNSKLVRRRVMVTGPEMPCGLGLQQGPASSSSNQLAASSLSSAGSVGSLPGGAVGGGSSLAMWASGGIRSLSFSADDSMIVAVAGGTAVGGSEGGEHLSSASHHQSHSHSHSHSHTSPPGGNAAGAHSASTAPSIVGVFSMDRGKVVAVTTNTGEHSGTGARAAATRVLGASFSPVHPTKVCMWGVNLFSYFSIDENPAGASAPLPYLFTPVPPSQAFLEWMEPNLGSASAAAAAAAHAAGDAGLEQELVNLSGEEGNGSGGGGYPPSPGSPGSPGSSFIGGGAAGGRASPSSPGGLSLSSSLVMEGVTFTAHAWLSSNDYNVVATRRGEVLLFQRETFVRLLASSPCDGRSIDVAASTPRGFLTAGEAGCVRIWEAVQPPPEAPAGGKKGKKSSGRAGSAGPAASPSSENQPFVDPGPYACARALQASIAGLESEDRIRSLALNPSGSTAILTLAGTQILQLDVANAHVKDDSTAFTTVGALSHAPPVGQSCSPCGAPDLCGIVSMSNAFRKPLVATVGTDGTVRVWNFVEKTAEIVKYYPEGAACVALHPSGLIAAVGFQDRIKLMTVSLDDLRDMRQYMIKGCTILRFSRGGTFFAAVSGNVILVYSAYTGEYVQTLRGHNGKIISIEWAYNDATLLSVAADGAVYEWDMRDGKRARELMLKGAKFASIAGVKDGSTLFGVGDGGLVAKDGTYGGPSPALREIDMNTGTVAREWALPSQASSIVLSNTNPRMLFTGSGALTGGVPSEGRLGIIRSYPVPLISGSSGVVEIAGPSCPVSHMLLSHDDAFLFVAGGDGCVIVYDVKDSTGRGPPPSEAPKLPWAEETLMTLADLEERKASVRELRDAVAELQSNASYNLRLKDMAFDDAMKRMAERAQTEVEQLRQQADLLAEETADSERDFADALAKMENDHRTEMQKREAFYQTRIMDEVEKYQALQAEVGRTTAAWKAKRAAAEDRHTTAVEETTHTYERKLGEVRDRRSGLEKDVEGGKTDWNEMRSQMEGDLDDEVAATRKAYQDRLDAEREQALKFKGENGIMKKKFAALQRDIEENKETIGAALERQDGLRRVIDGLEKEIALLRGQIYDRDTTIGDKEKRIYELKKKNQELEKFKFVLDYKIKELKAQVEPREAEIGALRAQIKEVDAELEAYHKANTELDGMVGTLRTNLDGLQLEARNLRADVNKRTQAIRDFSSDLYTTVQIAKLPHEYVAGIKSLAKKYIPEKLPAGSGDVAVIAESERQREYLQTLAEDLRVKGAEQTARARLENGRLVEENLALIQQLKSLREAIGNMRAQLKGIEVERTRNAHQAHARSLAQASAAARAATSSAGGGHLGGAGGASSSLRGGLMSAGNNHSPGDGNHKHGGMDRFSPGSSPIAAVGGGSASPRGNLDALMLGGLVARHLDPSGGVAGSSSSSSPRGSEKATSPRAAGSGAAAVADAGAAAATAAADADAGAGAADEAAEAPAPAPEPAPEPAPAPAEEGEAKVEEGEGGGAGAAEASEAAAEAPAEAAVEEAGAAPAGEGAGEGGGSGGGEVEAPPPTE